jgi:hypothetical protein
MAKQGKGRRGRKVQARHQDQYAVLAEKAQRENAEAQVRYMTNLRAAQAAAQSTAATSESKEESAQ